MGPLGMGEIIVLFILALLVFGPKKLPELGKTFGKGLAEFKRASNELKTTFQKEMDNIEQETKDVTDLTKDVQRDIKKTYQDNIEGNYDDYDYDDDGNDGQYSSGSITSGQTDSTTATPNTTKPNPVPEDEAQQPAEQYGLQAAGEPAASLDESQSVEQSSEQSVSGPPESEVSITESESA